MQYCLIHIRHSSTPRKYGLRTEDPRTSVWAALFPLRWIKQQYELANAQLYQQFRLDVIRLLMQMCIYK